MAIRMNRMGNLVEQRGVVWNSGLPEIMTERLRIRIPGRGDAEALSRYRTENKEHLARWEPSRPSDWCTTRFISRRIVYYQRDARAGQAYSFLMECKQDPDDVAGTVHLSNVSRGAIQSCTLGYTLDRRLQGAGLMTEAVEAVVNFAFQDLNLRRVEACYMPSNDRSGRLLKRVGFDNEGILKSSLIIQGQWEDHVICSKINEDWRPTPIAYG